MAESTKPEWQQQEENAWKKAAAEADSGRGISLLGVNVDTDMADVYAELNVTEIGPKSRLRAYIQSLQKQDRGTYKRGSLEHGGTYTTPEIARDVSVNLWFAETQQESCGFVTRIPNDKPFYVSDLQQKVKAEFANKLSHCDAPVLAVLKPGVKAGDVINRVPKESVRPYNQILELGDGDSVDVIAPKRGSLGQKRRLEELLFYHRSAIETCSSKSSKLARLRKLEDGSKRCFLCGASGTPANKIEASHVLQKQDIYATGGEEALWTLDILKNWSHGLGWKRPFKIHDPMNLIWLCHAHNVAFDRHDFGLSLGGLDRSVVFFSRQEEYAQLVADANTRLADARQPFYDTSYVSRRAIGMRLYKAQRAGHFIDHSNPNGWEAVVALSAEASLKTQDDSEEDEMSDEYASRSSFTEEGKQRW